MSYPIDTKALGLVETHLVAVANGDQLSPDHDCLVCKVVAAEREACAKIADDVAANEPHPDDTGPYGRHCASDIAAAIRARKGTP